MSYIYKITNDLNDKVYIGLTTRTLDLRWREHCRKQEQLIDKVIHLYGSEHFTISLVEECDDNLLDEREQYWIKYYDSYNNGYNCTLGGRNNQAICTPKMEEVQCLWNSGLSIAKIVKATKLNVETVRNYITKLGVSDQEVKERGRYFSDKAKAKPVLQYSLQGEFIKEWPSASEASRQLGCNRSNINAVCHGQRNCAGGFKWKFKEEL